MSISNLCAYIPSENTTPILNLAAKHDKFADSLKYRLSYLMPYIELSAEEFNALPNRATIEKQIASYNETEGYFLQVGAAAEVLLEHIRDTETEKILLRCQVQRLSANAPEYVKEKSVDEREVIRYNQLVKWDDHLSPSEERREPDRPSLENYQAAKAHLDFMLAEIRTMRKHKAARAYNNAMYYENYVKLKNYPKLKTETPAPNAPAPACAIIYKLCPNNL